MRDEPFFMNNMLGSLESSLDSIVSVISNISALNNFKNNVGGIAAKVHRISSSVNFVAVGVFVGSFYVLAKFFDSSNTRGIGVFITVTAASLFAASLFTTAPFFSFTLGASTLSGLGIAAIVIITSGL